MWNLNNINLKTESTKADTLYLTRINIDKRMTKSEMRSAWNEIKIPVLRVMDAIRYRLDLLITGRSSQVTKLTRGINENAK